MARKVLNNKTALRRRTFSRFSEVVKPVLRVERAEMGNHTPPTGGLRVGRYCLSTVPTSDLKRSAIIRNLFAFRTLYYRCEAHVQAPPFLRYWALFSRFTRVFSQCHHDLLAFTARLVQRTISGTAYKTSFVACVPCVRVVTRTREIDCTVYVGGFLSLTREIASWLGSPYILRDYVDCNDNLRGGYVE